MSVEIIRLQHQLERLTRRVMKLEDRVKILEITPGFGMPAGLTYNETGVVTNEDDNDNSAQPPSVPETSTGESES